ncbi:MAG: formylglycine-generating enzyme family protein [Deltaproteobacteria bacterium]|nr:formylglycine-generating enzyme family protein [Deltaproteobacteria bacterium]MBI3293451.1 formylglycine-generating enzyme family protein [Deltaproteobacteria bacterium]
MKHAIILLGLLVSPLAVADVVVVDKAQKRFWVAYVEGAEVVVKSCLVVPREGAARDCSRDVVARMKTGDWLAALLISVVPESDSGSGVTLDTVTSEIERLNSGEAVDAEVVAARVSELSSLQKQLVLVMKVQGALGSSEPEKFEQADLLKFVSAGKSGVPSVDNTLPHFIFVAIPGTNFQMQTTEVTQGLWKTVMRNNPSAFPGDERPVERVSFNDITEVGGFLDKLNESRKLVGDSCTYRLPTDEEWKEAAAGGTTSDYSFGNSPDFLDQHGWYKKNPNSALGTHGVAQLRKNPFGLFDVHGNVSEWTTSIVSGTTYRVLRGGKWTDDASSLRTLCFGCNAPNSCLDAIGFRLLRTCQSKF